MSLVMIHLAILELISATSAIQASCARSQSALQDSLQNNPAYVLSMAPNQRATVFTPAPHIHCHMHPRPYVS